MPDPAPRPSLLERVKRARLVQVVLVYLAASWGVLWIVGALTALLSLPGWVQPVAVFLLGAGLVVVTSTAWVQAMPSTDEAERAGRVPTDWEVAPAELLDAIREGKFPHLTWARAIMGGVLALSSLLLAALLYAAVTGRL